MDLYRKSKSVEIKGFPKGWYATKGIENLVLAVSYFRQEHALVLFQQKFATNARETNHGRRIRPQVLEDPAATLLMERRTTFHDLVKSRKYTILGVFPFNIESNKDYSISSEALYALFQGLPEIEGE